MQAQGYTAKMSLLRGFVVSSVRCSSLTKGRKIATLVVLLLVLALFCAAPAYATATDEAQETAQTASNWDAGDWFWCQLGYEDYCY